MDKLKSDKLKIYSLASSSSGNAFIFIHEDKIILIDCGISFTQLKNKLFDLGYDTNDITDIFITHEHEDHIGGLRLISRKTCATIHMPKNVFENLKNRKDVICEERTYEFFKPNDSFVMANIKITPIELSHDCIQCVGFVFELPLERVLFVTDTGYIPKHVYDYVENIDYAIVESNYDMDMLMNGDYAYSIKVRNASNIGHLSNDQAGEFCKILAQNGLKKVLLAHISKNNNTEELAIQTVAKYLNDFKDIQIMTAKDKETIGFIT